MTTWTIRIPHTVRNLAEHEVIEALPRETGGILIGWRERHGTVHTVAVSRMIVVPDPNAGTTHYTLNHDAAQAALDEHRAHHPDDAEGYVGEWHSHPENQPPSTLDHASITAAAANLQLPIAMIVMAFDPNNNTHTTYGHVAHRRRLRRALTLTPATVFATTKGNS